MKNFTSLVIALVLTTGLFVQNVNAATRYVKYNASGSNDGTSWTNAYTDLQSALTPAASGVQIWVAAGTYKPGSGSPTRSSKFDIPSGVLVYGGFAGTESNLADRNWGVNVTILSGDIGTIGVATDNVYHVVTSSGATATLDGFTITGGYANGTGNTNGGAVYLGSGTLTIKNCTINSNYAGFSGGAIFVSSSSTGLSLTNCLFTTNTSNQYAGAIGINAATTITNCTFSANSAYYGGAIGAYDGIVNINNSIIYNNLKDPYGSDPNIQNGIGSNLDINYSCWPEAAAPTPDVNGNINP